MPKLILLFFVLFMPLAGWAAKNENLEKYFLSQFSMAKDDDEKIRWALKLFYYYKDDEFSATKAKPYLLESQMILNKGSVSPAYEADFLRAQAWMYMDEFEYPTAYDHFYKSTLIAEANKIDTIYILARSGIAQLYIQIRNYYLADDILDECIAKLHILKRYRELGINYGHKARIAGAFREFHLASYYTHKSIEYYQLINDKRSEINEWNNLGVYQYQKGNKDSAMRIYLHAYEMAEENNLRETFSFLVGNIGTHHMFNGNYPLAESMLREDYLNSLKNNYLPSAQLALITIAKVKFLQKEFNRAMEIIDSAQAMHGPYTSFRTYTDLNVIKASILFERGQKDEAFNLLNSTFPTIDSVRKQNNIESANLALKNHKVEKQRAESTINAHFEQLKKFRMRVVLPLFFILIIGIIFTLKYFKSRRIINELSSEIFELKSKNEDLEKELVLKSMRESKENKS